MRKQKQKKNKIDTGNDLKNAEMTFTSVRIDAKGNTLTSLFGIKILNKGTIKL